MISQKYQKQLHAHILDIHVAVLALDGTIDLPQIMSKILVLHRFLVDNGFTREQLMDTFSPQEGWEAFVMISDAVDKVVHASSGYYLFPAIHELVEALKEYKQWSLKNN